MVRDTDDAVRCVAFKELSKDVTYGDDDAPCKLLLLPSERYIMSNDRGDDSCR